MDMLSNPPFILYGKINTAFCQKKTGDFVILQNRFINFGVQKSPGFDLSAYRFWRIR